MKNKKIEKVNFWQKTFFEIKILHLLNAYQKSIKRKSKNIYKNKNVLIKRKCFEIYAIDYKIYKNRFKYWKNCNND